jgi:hypothetical protein
MRGEPGIGKSALLAGRATRAREQGMTVLTTMSVQTEPTFTSSGYISSCDRSWPGPRVFPPASVLRCWPPLDGQRGSGSVLDRAGPRWSCSPTPPPSRPPSTATWCPAPPDTWLEVKGGWQQRSSGDPDQPPSQTPVLLAESIRVIQQPSPPTRAASSSEHWHRRPSSPCRLR